MASKPALILENATMSVRRAALFASLMLLALPATAFSEPWTLWQASDESSAVEVDHSPWQAFLDRYVAVGDNGINLVAYGDVAATDRELLDGYLASLSQLDPRTLSKDEQFAYWVNLYNALTVQVVLDNPTKGSIRRMGKGLFSFGPWDDELLTIAGEAVTLNDIEHRILRPIWRDHRIHYAVNCASIGCPNLSTTAFAADNLEAQLNAAERAYVEHPRGVHLSDGKLTLSSIYDWYAEDFAADERGLLEHLAARHPNLGDALRSFSGRVRYDYDWNPNASSR